MSHADDQPIDDDDGEADTPAAELPTVDAASPRGRETQLRRIKREALEAEEFWRGALANPVGRRELWRLLAGDGGAHVFETRFLSGSVGFPDSNATWYARGEQDFGLRLYHKWLQLDPGGVALMHSEHDHRFAKPRKRGA